MICCIIFSIRYCPSTFWNTRCKTLSECNIRIQIYSYTATFIRYRIIRCFRYRYYTTTVGVYPRFTYCWHWNRNRFWWCVITPSGCLFCSIWCWYTTYVNSRPTMSISIIISICCFTFLSNFPFHIKWWIIPSHSILRQSQRLIWLTRTCLRCNVLCTAISNSHILS